jgi:general secretion pathway protein I
MVALAILGLALSAILSAQAGMYSANVQARNITLGSSAARCKMSELEERLLKDGYPEADENDEGACCDDESPPGFVCRWHIERVTLPDPPASDDGGLGGLGADGGGGLGGFGALAGAAANPGSIGDGGVAGLSQVLSQGVGPNGQTGVMGIAGMAMTIVYPQLRPLLEASIRRVSVEVVWNEGPTERKIEIVQFVTNPNKGLPPIMPGMDDAGIPLPGAPTGTATAGAGAGGVAAPIQPGMQPGVLQK